MKRRHSLTVRIASAFILLALVVCTFFTVTGNFALQVAEKQLINNRLEKATTRLINQYQRHFLLSTEEDNFYVNDEIPDKFRHLRPGIHELHSHDDEITVCIRQVGNDIFAVTDDTSDFETTERLARIALGAGFIASLLLALVLGLGLARRIVAPVTALAHAVERNDEPSSLPSLQTDNEIGMLARAFAGRTNQLQEFLADEKLFTGDVSHELRTPLTIILGASELLKVRLQNAPQELEVAERIRRVALEASERVGALLLLSQSPQVLQGTPTSLTHLVEREIERYQPMLADKPVRIEFDGGNEEVWIHARPELVGIAVSNLIRNACQYTERGVIRITLRRSQLIVEDEGPGLPENVRARLFERYVRGPDQRHVGSGLGLAIVKRVLDHLGWQIEHAVAEHGGSRFIVTFEGEA